MIAQNTKASAAYAAANGHKKKSSAAAEEEEEEEEAVRGEKVEWSPQAALSALGDNDSVEVSCKITVPAAVGGLILGKGGETIKHVATESGARVLMTRSPFPFILTLSILL
jgi:hypothetical protein